jgi:hypothetical protein
MNIAGGYLADFHDFAGGGNDIVRRRCHKGIEISGSAVKNGVPEQVDF